MFNNLEYVIYRLWDKPGQDKLINTRILIFGDTTLTSEILKNLILSGIKGYAIIESKDMEHCDNDYIMTTYNSTDNLSSAMQQFDDSVEMIHCGDNWYESENLKRFDVFIISNFSICDLSLIQRVVDWMFSNDKLVLDVRTSSQLGYISCHKKTHLVINSHSSNNITPLFITNPFPELKHFYESTWDKYIQSQKSIRIPYPVYLHHYYKEWKSTNIDVGIEAWSKDQKQDFKSFINTRTDLLEEDYINTYVIPYIHHIWSDDEKISKNLTLINQIDSGKFDKLDPVFSVLIKMLSNPKVLCCTGVVPDMECDTNIFVEFVRIIKSKYDALVKEYSKNIHIYIPSIPLDHIELQVGLYLRHIGEIVLLSGKRLQLENHVMKNCTNFYESIYFSLKNRNHKSFDSLSIYINDHLYSHNIMVDSILGAISAQEVIKYCTGHYIPLSENQILIYQSLDLAKEPFKLISITDI